MLRSALELAEIATRIAECPRCGAPLPGNHGAESVTCASCGEVVSRAADLREGDAALADVQRSRAEAEQLYRTLGSPPTLSQRVAVVLANKWLWIFGLPFMLSLFYTVGLWIAHAIEAVYELLTHTRLVHVASGATLSLLWVGSGCFTLAAVFVWSLFGERVGARRDLQAALAAKPPESPGGPARCRHCSAPISVPSGALGVRCSYCGADNLVRVAPAWTRRAKKVAADLQMSTATARAHAAEGRRRVLRAAMWRLPIAIGVTLFAVLTAGGLSGWGFAQSRCAVGKPGRYGELIHEPEGRLSKEWATFFDCHDMAKRTKASQLVGKDSRWCDDPKDPNTLCFVEAVFPLTRGDRFHLITTVPGFAAARFELAERDSGGLGAIGGYGDFDFKIPVASGLVGADTLDVPIDVTGWYRLELTANSYTALWPCADTSGGR